MNSVTRWQTFNQGLIHSKSAYPMKITHFCWRYVLKWETSTNLARIEVDHGPFKKRVTKLSKHFFLEFHIYKYLETETLTSIFDMNNTHRFTLMNNHAKYPFPSKRIQKRDKHWCWDRA